MRSRTSIAPIELAVTLAVMAVLATIAAPWWQTQRRSAMAAEASDNLRRILHGAAAYYDTAHAISGKPKPAACYLPELAIQTPTGTSCCIDQNDADDDQRCDANPANWNNATWQALQFKLVDPHFCTYSWQAAANASGAWTMTASAYADMDCDTLMATFQLTGTAGGKPDGSCTFAPGKTLFRDHELE